MNFTTKQIKEAAQKANDHILANPDSYNFDSGHTNSYCKCGWGWVGHFLEIKGYYWEVAKLCGYDETINGLCPITESGEEGVFDGQCRPENGARAIRKLFKLGEYAGS